MPAIRTCLWFDTQAEEAAQFYVSVFPNSEISTVTRYAKDTPGPEGQVMTVEFTLDGAPFTGLNGGPHFTFSEAVSFEVHVAGQDEVDRYWHALGDGGEESMCGWLKDRFGVSWQVIPAELIAAINDSDPERGYRATQAMLTMHRIDIAAIQRAADGESSTG